LLFKRILGRVFLSRIVSNDNSLAHCEHEHNDSA
jgi:hypothetical protein